MMQHRRDTGFIWLLWRGQLGFCLDTEVKVEDSNSTAQNSLLPSHSWRCRLSHGTFCLRHLLTHSSVSAPRQWGQETDEEPSSLESSILLVRSKREISKFTDFAAGRRGGQGWRRSCITHHRLSSSHSCPSPSSLPPPLPVKNRILGFISCLTASEQALGIESTPQSLTLQPNQLS